VSENKQARRRTGAPADEEKNPPSLAAVQAELEGIIERLEDEETGLERSIELYERGSRLVSAASWRGAGRGGAAGAGSGTEGDDADGALADA
jgi:hypothetical protein